MASRQSRRRQQRVTQRGRRPKQKAPWYFGPWGLALGVAAMVVIVVVIIVAGNSAKSKTGDNAFKRRPAPGSILRAVQHPSSQIVQAVGSGGVPMSFIPIKGHPKLWTSGGLPVVFYFGAEFCPYCAAERWAMINAFSRFGTFSGIKLMKSSASDAYPSTNTFTFYGSTYRSKYVVFDPKEVQDRNQQNLQALNGRESAAVNSWNRPPYSATTQSFPFIDFADRAVGGIGYNAGVLHTDPASTSSPALSWHAIVNDLSSASTPQAQGILGEANWLAAAICRLTGNKPASVCGARPIPSLQRQLTFKGQ